jgi:hypothetical protein
MLKPAMPVAIRFHDGERSAVVNGSGRRGRRDPGKKASGKKANEKQGSLL